MRRDLHNVIIIIIRPHQSISWMWPIATDNMLHGLLVGLSVCNDHDLCKNGQTDRDVVFSVDLGGPKELCTVLMKSRSPHRKGHF